MHTVNYPQFNYTARSKFSFILCTLYFYALTIPLLPLCSSKTSSSMSLYRCVVVAGTASESETELEAKLANQSQSVAVVSLCPIVQPNAPAVPPPPSLPFSPSASLFNSCNDESHVQSLWLVFSFCYYLQKLLFFFLLLFFAVCRAALVERFYAHSVHLACCCLPPVCPHHHHRHCPFCSVPIRSVRFGSVSRCLLLCVRATNVCLRKPFLAF